MDLVDIDPKVLEKWDRPVPRYTSYPTAPQFYEIDEKIYQEKLAQFDTTKKPLSLYFHIPFCKTMCLFCGCSVVLNRKPERQTNYIAHLLKEIEITCSFFSKKREVVQLHFGGGTPTSLTKEQFVLLMQKIRTHFSMAPHAEVSIEIDPRTVYEDQGEKLSFLKELGFNRISFGVQDLDPLVQKAVKRHQTEEMTVATYEKARSLGFAGINIDLIYGLPHQTVERFSKTVQRLIELKPDRIALYSYAKIPWLKEHQKAISDDLLPSTQEKFRIYVDARSRFMKGGYQAIGMDHFAKTSDSLAKSYEKRELARNFQGYSTAMAEDMIGFGLTSIGFIENGYFQNIKDLKSYQQTLEKGSLPIFRGVLLNEEDRRRKKIILDLMCHFEVEKKGLPEADLQSLKEEGFLIETEEKWIATPLGRLFIRLIAAKFDAYLHQGKFSKSI